MNILLIDRFWKSGWLIHKSALCTRIVLLPVRSQNDLKVPRKRTDVTNILISTANRISKSVYYVNVQILRSNYNSQILWRALTQALVHSFAASVKRANISSAPEKKQSMRFSDLGKWCTWTSLQTAPTLSSLRTCSHRFARASRTMLALEIKFMSPAWEYDVSSWQGRPTRRCRIKLWCIWRPIRCPRPRGLRLM